MKIASVLTMINQDFVFDVIKLINKTPIRIDPIIRKICTTIKLKKKTM